jgi:hypothetical protein
MILTDYKQQAEFIGKDGFMGLSTGNLYEITFKDNDPYGYVVEITYNLTTDEDINKHISHSSEKSIKRYWDVKTEQSEE